MVRCDQEGNPLPNAKVVRMWTCTPKPANDYYSFTNFAHKLNGCEGMFVPLPSDSRWDGLLLCTCFPWRQPLHARHWRLSMAALLVAPFALDV